MNKYQRRESRLIKKMMDKHYRWGFCSAQYRKERRTFRATIRFAKMMSACGATVRVCDPTELPRVEITRAEVDHE